MIDKATLERLKARNATVFRMRVPSYTNERAVTVPEYVSVHQSRSSACRDAVLFDHRGPLCMPTPLIEPVKAREL